MPSLEWEIVLQTVPKEFTPGKPRAEQPPPAFRARVHGGWLVYATPSQDAVGGHYAMAFVPDPTGAWGEKEQD